MKPVRATIPCLLCLVVLAGAGCASPEASSPAIEPPSEQAEIGRPLPDFALESFDGSTVSLSSLRGQPVLIDFWAAWSAYSVAEMRQLEILRGEYEGRAAIIGIHRSDTESPKTGKAFARDRGATYPLLVDADGSAFRFLAGDAPFMPVAIFVDADGILRESLYGAKTGEQMRERLDALLMNEEDL